MYDGGYVDDRLARWLLACRKLEQMLKTDPRLNLVRKGSNIATVCGAPIGTRDIVGLAISMADHESETSYPSQRSLAKMTGHGRTSVSLALDWAVDEYYLARVSGKKGMNSRYRPTPETAHGFVLGDENFWENFLHPKNSGGLPMGKPLWPPMGEHSGLPMGEHESSIDDSENSGEFIASPSGSGFASPSADYGFPYFWSLLKKFGRIGQFWESKKKVEKKYKTALTYPGVTDEILCTRYHASLRRYYGKKNFTYPGEWLGNPDNYTTGSEDSGPVPIKKKSGKTRRASASKPVGSTDDSPALAKLVTTADMARYRKAFPNLDSDAADDRITFYTVEGLHSHINETIEYGVLTVGQVKDIQKNLNAQRVTDLDTPEKRNAARDMIVAAMESNFPDAPWENIYATMHRKFFDRKVREM